MSSAISGPMKFVRACLYGTLLTPLLVATGFLLPFNTPKVLAFQILVELALIAFSLIQLSRISLGKTLRNLPGLPLVSALSISLAAFLGYSLIAAAFGADFQRSLWGLEERQDGLVLLIHFYFWWLIFLWYVRSQETLDSVQASAEKRPKSVRPALSQCKRFLNFSYWVSAVAALSALFQWAATAYSFLGPLDSLMAAQTGTRAGGVMGNPEYLGPYLLFHFFYGLYLFHSELQQFRLGSLAGKRAAAVGGGRKAARLVLLLSVDLTLVAAVAVGQTRGVVLGLALGLAVLGIDWALSLSHRLRTFLALALCLALLFGGLALWRLRDSAAVGGVPLLSRFAELVNPETVSMRVRRLLWGGAWEGFKDRPVFGWGHDNEFYALNKHYNPEMVRNDMQSGSFLYSWNDKAHNAFLDLLVEKGLAGAILFLIVAAMVLRSLWRLSNRQAAYYLAAGLAAYAASIAVSFDTFGSFLGLFLFFAWCDLEGRALPHAPRLAANPAPGASKNKQKNPSGHRKAASLLLAGACIVGLYLNVEIGMASSGCHEAQAVFLARPPAGLASYQEAFQHFYPYQDKQKLQCAALLVQSLIQGGRGSGDQAKIESALRIGQEAVSAHPLDAYLSLWLAVLHIDLGVNVDKKYLEGGKVFGEKALELSPMRQEIMLHLSRTYRALGESRRAVDMNRRMVDADPAYPQAHWYYGLSLIDDHQMEVGKKEVRKALDLGYQPRDRVEAQIVKELFGS